MAEVLEGIGCVKAKGKAVKTCLSTRPVSFNTKPEVEVYRLANNTGSMRYDEHKRSKRG